MKRWTRLFVTVITGLMTFNWLVLPTWAVSPPTSAVPGGLSVAEIKITGDEFVIIQNNTGANITDLSSYWLQVYNNVSPLAAGVNNTSQQLPLQGLGAGQTLLLSANAMSTCGAAVAGKLSVSLGDSGGFLEVVQLSQNASGAVVQTPGDVVSWSSGTSGIIQSVPSSTKAPRAVYYRYHQTAGYTWQLGDTDASNACQLNVSVAGVTQPAPNNLNQLLPTTQPPVTILSLMTTSEDGDGVVSLPAGDIGLMAPAINELLPNPLGSGNDATDEFIEIYNPNTVAFDLSGFTLQTGITSTHQYKFPGGTSLPAKNFAAFYSADSGLSLSNSGGQAQLIDPLGNVISASNVYGSAKDGQTWALAKGKWYWTTKPTPNSANIINQPTAKKSSSKATAGKKSSTAGKVKGAVTNGSAANGGFVASAAALTPIHPWVLAVVAALALLYATYEYRHDLANRLYQFRSNRAARRQPRS